MFWHQLLRRRSQTATGLAARTLGLPRHHSATIMIRVVLAFAICGAIHSVPLYFASGVEGNQMLYFGIQPVGIAIEMLVEFLTQGWAIGEIAKRWIGRCWVLVWFGFTNVLFVRGLFEARLEPLWLYGNY